VTALDPVIPNECEGSKKDFLPSVEMTMRFFAFLASWREKVRTLYNTEV
jgi:hypothetical protein